MGIDAEQAKVIRLRRPSEPLLRDLLGAALRRTRQQRHFTLATVAGRAGVSIAYLSEIERGRKEPSSEILAALCRGLDIGLVDLVTGSLLVLREQEARTLASVRIAAPRPVNGAVCLAA